jgi:tetratricopeptide (TPR) repeat protein
MGNVKSAREDRERASSIDPVIAGRNWSLKSAQPGDARAFDFREIHHADVKALETWYEQMRKENASLCCLSRMAGAGEARFNAIVVFDGNPLPFRLFRYRTDGDLLADPVFKMGISRFTHNVEVVDGKEGLCLLNGDEDHSAGLWFGNADATRQKLEAARNERSRPIVLDNKRIIVSANEGISWKEYQGLTAEEMRAVVRRAASARRRPDLLSAYADEKGAVRFSVVFIDNWGGPEWSYDLALKPAEYERRIPEQRSKGFRPHALISWREGHELRYGCIWLKMAPKLATADAQAEAKRYLDEAIRFERSKDWKRAERACSEALHLDANLLEAHEHRYRARINLERWTSALADVNELIRCNPKDLQWVHNRSWLYLQMDDLDRTIEQADEGIALAVPDSFFHILLLRNKGFAYAKCGQLKKGLEIYNDAASRSPNDATVYFERSSIHEALGNVAEAKADLEKAIEIDANLKTKPPWKFPKKLLPKKTNDGGNE